MKSVSKFRFRPEFMTLEGRTQPGSLLTSGLSALGSALDLNSMLDDSSSSPPAPIHRLNDLNQTTLGSGAETISIAPGHSGTLSQPTPVAAPSSDSNLAAQLTAVNAASRAGVLGTSATPVHSAPLSGGAANHANSHSITMMPPVVAPAHAGPDMTSMMAATGLHSVTGASWVGSLGGGVNPLFSVNNATYLPGPSMNKIATDSAGNVYVAGAVTDPTDATKTDAAVLELSSDMSTLIASELLVPTNSGDSASANGLQVDASGVVYLTGTINVSGANQLFASRISTLGTPADWTVSWTYADPSYQDQGAGCRLDSTGTFLYVTGQVDVSGAGGSSAALIIARLTNLSSVPPTLDAWGGAASFGTDLTPGNDIAPASDGVHADIAAQDNNGANLDLAVNTDGASAGGILFGNAGANGNMNGVALDASDNAYYTGAAYLGTETASRAILAEIGPGGGLADVVYGWGWGAQTSVQADWTQSGNLENITGNDPYTSGTIYDNVSPPDQNATIAIVHFTASAATSTIVDSQPFGGAPLSGSLNDYGNGIAVGIFNAIFACGNTTSTDFATTPGAFQTAYLPGAIDGWAANTTLS